jgi:hypothetical protein
MYPAVALGIAGAVGMLLLGEVVIGAIALAACVFGLVTLVRLDKRFRNFAKAS